MTPIEQAREFVIQSLFDPVLNATVLDKKTQDIVKNRKVWIEHFTRVGDLSLYLNRFTVPGETEVYKTLKAHDFKTFEDKSPPQIGGLDHLAAPLAAAATAPEDQDFTASGSAILLRPIFAASCWKASILCRFATA